MLYFIGKDTHKLFSNTLQLNLQDKYHYFSDINDFISYAGIKNLSTNDAANLYNDKILVYDEITQSNLNLHSISNYFKKVYVYEELYNIFLTIFNSYKYIYENMYYTNYDYNFLNTRLNLLKDDYSFQILIVGLSYALLGLDENLFKYKAINLSLSSQDLYYSYKLSEKVLNINKNIKYCVVNIAYYSLHFDMSRGGESYRINDVYFPILKDSHHFTANQLTNVYSINAFDQYLNEDLKTLFDTTFLENHFKNIFFQEISKNYFNDKISRISRAADHCDINYLPEYHRESLGFNRANQHNNLLIHTQTVNENIKILSDFLYFLTTNNVKPILCILPTSSYYNKYLNKTFSTTLLNVLANLKSKYDFKLIDYTNFDNFSTADFIDADHLNYQGTLKATEILNNTIT